MALIIDNSNYSPLEYYSPFCGNFCFVINIIFPRNSDEGSKICYELMIDGQLTGKQFFADWQGEPIDVNLSEIVKPYIKNWQNLFFRKYTVIPEPIDNSVSVGLMAVQLTKDENNLYPKKNEVIAECLDFCPEITDVSQLQTVFADFITSSNTYNLFGAIIVEPNRFAIAATFTGLEADIDNCNGFIVIKTPNHIHFLDASWILQKTYSFLGINYFLSRSLIDIPFCNNVSNFLNENTSQPVTIDALFNEDVTVTCYDYPTFEFSIAELQDSIADKENTEIAITENEINILPKLFDFCGKIGNELCKVGLSCILTDAPCLYVSPSQSLFMYFTGSQIPEPITYTAFNGIFGQPIVITQSTSDAIFGLDVGMDSLGLPSNTIYYDIKYGGKSVRVMVERDCKVIERILYVNTCGVLEPINFKSCVATQVVDSQVSNNNLEKNADREQAEQVRTGICFGKTYTLETCPLQADKAEYFSSQLSVTPQAWLEYDKNGVCYYEPVYINGNTTVLKNSEENKRAVIIEINQANKQEGFC